MFLHCEEKTESSNLQQESVLQPRSKGSTYGSQAANDLSEHRKRCSMGLGVAILP